MQEAARHEKRNDGGFSVAAMRDLHGNRLTSSCFRMSTCAAPVKEQEDAFRVGSTSLLLRRRLHAPLGGIMRLSKATADLERCTNDALGIVGSWETHAFVFGARKRVVRLAKATAKRGRSPAGDHLLAPRPSARKAKFGEGRHG